MWSGVHFRLFICIFQFASKNHAGKKAHHLWKLFLFLSNVARAIQFRVQLVFPLTLFGSITLIYDIRFSRAEARCKINSKLNNFCCNNSAWEECGADEKHSMESATMRHLRWLRWQSHGLNMKCSFIPGVCADGPTWQQESLGSFTIRVSLFDATVFRRFYRRFVIKIKPNGSMSIWERRVPQRDGGKNGLFSHCIDNL